MHQKSILRASIMGAIAVSALLSAKPRACFAEAGALPNRRVAAPIAGAFEQDYVPDQLVVKFRRGALVLPEGKMEASLAEVTADPVITPLLVGSGMKRLRKVFPSITESDTVRILESGERINVEGFSRVLLLSFEPGIDIPALAKAYRASPEVVYAEPDYIYRADDHPHDEHFDDQWGLEQLNDIDVDAITAWDIQTGSYSVKLGILDSGIDYTHDDFGDNFGPDFKVSGGYDFVNQDTDPIDDRHHGTHVAGIAAALTHNFEKYILEHRDGDRFGVGSGPIGIAGVAGGWGYVRRTNNGNKGAQIVALKVHDDTGGGSSSIVANAILEGVDNYDVDVFNYSGGTGSPTGGAVVGEALLYATQMDKVFVAAKGNDGDDQPEYPADLAGDWVVSVGAIDNGGDRAYFSNYGNGIDVVAPGVDILSTMPTYMTQAMADHQPNPYNTDYDYMSGTSMATPFVAGLAALIRAQNPSLDAQDVQGIIKASATDLGPLGYDDEFGYGLINARRALELASAPWTILDGVAYGGTDEGYTGDSITFYGNGPIPEGSIWPVRRYEVRTNVCIGESSYPIYIWGRGTNTPIFGAGWSAANPNWQTGYCEVVSVTPPTAVLRTYVYKKLNLLGQPLPGWYPCEPSEANFEFSVLTVLGATRPDSRGGAESQALWFPEVPQELMLSEILPNPFEGATTVSFQLPQATQVSLCVYDLHGREVAMLQEGRLDRGEHQVIWHAGSIPSGAYICELSAGNYVDSKRMVLVRRR